MPKCRDHEARVAFRLACVACLCGHLVETEVGGHIMAASGAAVWRSERRIALWVDTRASVCQNGDVDCEPPQSSQVRGDRGWRADWCAPVPRLMTWSPRRNESDALNLKKHVFKVMEDIPARAC